MKDSVKANMIVFLIIAVAAFCISSAFASLTITDDSESYKLIPIKNDSFEPNYVYEVPTIEPKVKTNYTNNTTAMNITQDIDDLNDTFYNWNQTIEELYDDR